MLHLIMKDNLYLEKVDVIDVYKGDGIHTDKKSLTFALTFGVKHKTATKEEIDEYTSKIIESIESKFGAELRTK